MKASEMARVALLAALTAAAAQITIPLPPVPFTLQVLMVVLSGLLLGPRLGALAQGVYLLLGAAGLPVFAGFKGGLGHLVGPTGGYLVSYPLAAALAGLAAVSVARSNRLRAVLAGTASGLLALVAIYALGASWLAVQAGLTPPAALAAGVLPFVPLDVLKVVLAAMLATAVAPQINPRSPAVGGER
jgi:biotin transport system substrate-specific component